MIHRVFAILLSASCGIAITNAYAEESVAGQSYRQDGATDAASVVARYQQRLARFLARFKVPDVPGTGKTDPGTKPDPKRDYPPRSVPTFKLRLGVEDPDHWSRRGSLPDAARQIWQRTLIDASGNAREFVTNLPRDRREAASVELRAALLESSPTGFFPAVGALIQGDVGSVQKPLAHKGSMVCSGVLVGPRQFLTASHCQDRIHNETGLHEDQSASGSALSGDVPADGYTVFVGDHGGTAAQAANYPRYWVYFENSGYYEVEKFSHTRPENTGLRDVAIGHLLRDVVDIQPLRIDSNKPANLTDVAIVGFGATTADTFDRGVKRTSKAFSRDCIDPKTNRPIPELLCFSYEKNSPKTNSHCLVNSGAPMIRRIPGAPDDVQADDLRVVGVASSGDILCAENGTYAEVTNTVFKDWREKQTSRSSQQPVRERQVVEQVWGTFPLNGAAVGFDVPVASDGMTFKAHLNYAETPNDPASPVVNEFDLLPSVDVECQFVSRLVELCEVTGNAGDRLRFSVTPIEGVGEFMLTITADPQ